MRLTRQRLNVGLLLLAAVLGIGIYLSQDKAAPEAPLTSLAADAVDRIRIQHPGHAEIQLQRTGDQWLMIAPVQAEVDTIELSALMELLERPVRRALDVDEGKLVELGLAPAKFSITLNDTEIAFGAVEKLEFQRYVKVGNQVSLVDDPPSAALDENYADLIAKRLFPAAAELQSIALPGLTVQRDAEDSWVLSPSNVDVSSDQLHRFAQAWRDARAMWIEPAKDTATSGDVVRIVRKDGSTTELRVVQRDPQFHLLHPERGVRYVLSKALTGEMLRIPDPVKDVEPNTPSQEAEPAT